MSPSSGLLLVDKDRGPTSHDVVARVRRLLGERRVGHAGTLDPMATGLLVLGVGPATRLLRFASASAKRYVGTARLGVATDSLDAQGVVTATAPVPDVGVEDLAAAARALTGTTLQVPPMVSAIKVGGERLHELARRGVEVERAPREVTVTSFSVERGDEDTLVFDVTCSAGTYVRVLVSDLAASLGTLAHLTSLRRVSSGRFDVADALTLADLEEAVARGSTVLRPASDFVAGLAAVTLTPDEERRVRQGQAIELAEGLEGDEVAALDAAGSLVAVLARRARTGRPELVLAPEAPRTRG